MVKQYAPIFLYKGMKIKERKNRFNEIESWQF